MNVEKRAVLAAVAGVIWRRFQVRPEPDQRFAWPEGMVVADLHFPAPLDCLVQFDDATHCTRERAATFAGYPADTPLSFDVRRYLADRAPGDPAIAEADARADLLPPRHGFNPTVRLRADEIAAGTGSLADRIEALLAHRLAVHAGTTFQQMIDNAGAKPHRTRGID